MKYFIHQFLSILIVSIVFISCDKDEGSTDDIEEEVVTEEPIITIDTSITPGNFDTPEVSDIEGYDQDADDLDEWSLIFEDNFSGNLSQWQSWNSGAFNNELQLYASDNLRTSDGLLFIKSERESVTGPMDPFTTTTKDFDFTSGRIETQETFSPGNLDDGESLRLSARILLPEGEGLWSAFWSFNDPWPTQGEIDILQFRGSQTNEYVTNFTYGVSTNFPDTNLGQTIQTIDVEQDLTAAWHVYETIWAEERVEILLDGVVIQSYEESDWEYINDFYNGSQRLILSLSVGGDFFSQEQYAIDEDDIPDEAFLAVDWVRVYKR